MSNIALTTALLALLAFPGFLFRFIYSAGGVRKVLPINWTQDIPKGIFYALPFHIVAIWFMDMLQDYYWINSTLNFELIFRLLVGEFGTGWELSDMAFKLNINARYLIGYFIGVTILSFLMGRIIGNFIWSKEWDLKFPTLFKFKSEVLYTILGRGKLPDVPFDKILVWAVVMSNIPTGITGKNVLYRGTVVGCSIENDGTLKELILATTQIGTFKESQSLGGMRPLRKRTFSWEPLSPGHNFVLKNSEIKNLNLTYLDVRQADD